MVCALWVHVTVYFRLCWQCGGVNKHSRSASLIWKIQKFSPRRYLFPHPPLRPSLVYNHGCAPGRHTCQWNRLHRPVAAPARDHLAFATKSNPAQRLQSTQCRIQSDDFCRAQSSVVPYRIVYIYHHHHHHIRLIKSWHAQLSTMVRKICRPN